jgi:hypothetical protein
MLEQSPTWFQLDLFPTNKMKMRQTISESKKGAVISADD